MENFYSIGGQLTIKNKYYWMWKYWKVLSIYLHLLIVKSIQMSINPDQKF